MNPPKRRRFRPQISLRAMLGATLLVGGVGGWIGMQWEQSYRERQAEQEIIEQLGSAGAFRHGEPDFFGNPRLIWARFGPQVPRPKYIRRYAQFAETERERTEKFYGPAPSEPAGYVRLLSAFARLRRLEIIAARLDEEALSALGDLHSVEHLDLSGCRFPPEALTELARARRLRELYLTNTNLTSADLAHLAGLVRLETLHLDCNRITDEGLVHLAGLTQLTELRLSINELSDDGVEHLARLKSLKYLELWGSYLSQDGFARLRAALPEAEIVPDVR